MNKVITQTLIDEPIIDVMEMGGQWYWSKRFPYLHRKDKYVVVQTTKAIYQIRDDK